LPAVETIDDRTDHLTILYTVIDPRGSSKENVHEI